MASTTTSAAVKASVARPRVNGSGSSIPLPPPSLQRARHTPAGPSTVAAVPTSNVTRPSRLPTRSVAPVRAPNSADVPAPAPRHGMVSAPVKPATAKSLNSLPRPKSATAIVAASPGRQTKPTSSVRALPRASEPTAKTSSAKPVVTKAAASQPRVGLPPKKQCAPVAPRTTKSVLAPAKPTLPPRLPVQKRSARIQTRPRLPRGRLPPVEDDGMEQVNAGLARAVCNARAEECDNHSQPYSGRDPFLHSALIVKGDGQLHRVQCRKGRDPSSGSYDEKHDRKPFPMSERMRDRFFMPCSSSRKIENRSSAAPKAKTVRFAGIETHTYRCLPACLSDPVSYRAQGESIVTWAPSSAQLARFRQHSASCVARADEAERLAETF